MSGQISSMAEYDDLAQAADVAEDALGSMRFGSHWLLIQKLKHYGVYTTDSKQAIKAPADFVTSSCKLTTRSNP